MSLPSPKSKATTTTTATDEERDRRQRKQLEELDKRIQEEYERYLDEWGWEIPKHEEEAIRTVREEIIKMMYLPAMQTLRTATINEIIPSLSPQKIISMNKGLIHLLQIINKAPNGQISTRKLLDIINSRDLHKLIKKGEELGFIRREKVPKPKGQKGNNITINSLTKEGRSLLEAADKLLNIY